MKVLLYTPDYSCVSKKVVYWQPFRARITDIVIISTGLKVLDEGE
ncbi:putative transposase [Aeromonas hydrophila]|nr:putative transposase [Aeromonas hydrophila]